MAPGCFLDTNVLLDAVSADPGEAPKRDLARQLLQEFFVQATRVSRPWALSTDEARLLIDCWGRFTVQPITWEVLQRALDLRAVHPLSYWDAAILAAAEQSGCTLLLSEDLSDGGQYGAVEVRSPFPSASTGQPSVPA